MGCTHKNGERTMNDWTLNVRIENKHLIAEIDGHLLLIDTGSPTSFGTCSFTWEDEQVDLSNWLKTIEIEVLRSQVGLPLEGLIGCDLLLRRGLRLDIPNGELALQDEIPLLRSDCKLGTVMSIPVVTSYVGGPRSVAIDTGAMQSFLFEDDAFGLERVGTVNDFYPGGGDFIADLVEAQVLVGENSRLIKAAVAPALLEAQLVAIGITGIFGLDVLKDDVFELAPTHGYMSPFISVIDLESNPNEIFFYPPGDKFSTE
jgi:hypothetical protein